MIFQRNKTNSLLFSHHAVGYDPTNEGIPFYNYSQSHLEELKKRRISIYILHAPLDKNGPYSTSVNLAKAAGLDIVSEFCEYLGIKVGVIGQTEFSTVEVFANRVREIMGHEIKVFPYGEPFINDGKVAVAAGGGNFEFIIHELAGLNCNTYLTGVTKTFPTFEPTVKFHDAA